MIIKVHDPEQLNVYLLLRGVNKHDEVIEMNLSTSALISPLIPWLSETEPPPSNVMKSCGQRGSSCSWYRDRGRGDRTHNPLHCTLIIAQSLVDVQTVRSFYQITTSVWNIIVQTCDQVWCQPAVTRNSFIHQNDFRKIIWIPVNKPPQ